MWTKTQVMTYSILFDEFWNETPVLKYHTCTIAYKKAVSEILLQYNIYYIQNE